jgi:hypothetical protein
MGIAVGVNARALACTRGQGILHLDQSLTRLQELFIVLDHYAILKSAFRSQGNDWSGSPFLKKFRFLFFLLHAQLIAPGRIVLGGQPPWFALIHAREQRRDSFGARGPILFAHAERRQLGHRHGLDARTYRKGRWRVEHDLTVVDGALESGD